MPMARTPRVSVVVPCYNYGRFLPQLVAGALAQPGVDVDVLIVDDASTDDSAQVARSLAVADARVSVLLHSHNEGHIRTYNDGLAKVTGDYVALVSADDLLPAGALSRAAALMEAQPHVGLVYGFARSFTGDPPSVDARVRNWSVWEGRHWLRLAVGRGRSFISSPEVVMRRKALRQVGFYDPRLPHSGDLDMWLRTALTWDIGRVNGPAQALYRVHESNMHLSRYAGMLTDLRERRKTFSILFDEHAADRPEVTRLRPRTMRSLARESLRLALVAHREHGDPALVQGHVDFARETYPAITSSALWRAGCLVLDSDRALPGVQVRRLASRARSHLLWRRERRYGT